MTYTQTNNCVSKVTLFLYCVRNCYPFTSDSYSTRRSILRAYLPTRLKPHPIYTPIRISELIKIQTHFVVYSSFILVLRFPFPFGWYDDRGSDRGNHLFIFIHIQKHNPASSPGEVRINTFIHTARPAIWWGDFYAVKRKIKAFPLGSITYRRQDKCHGV